ncbi:MAG: hypothetical protein ACREVL_01420, partial [Solimonas sp.]
MVPKIMKSAVALVLLGIVAVFPAYAGFFSTRFDDFKELVQAGKIEDAAALCAREQAYFSDLKGDKRKLVDDVMGQRDRRYRAELGEARARLILAEREDGQMLRWKKLKESLPEAQALALRLEKLPAPGPLTTDGMALLAAASARITLALESQAPQSLLDYGLFTEPSFAMQYPVALQWRNFTGLAAPIDKQIAKASARQLEAFKKAYGETLIPALGLSGKVGESYVSARVRESGASSYLARRLVRDRLAKEGWLPAGKTAGRVLLAAWPAPESAVGVFRAAPPNTIDYQLLEAAQTPGGFIASGNVSHELVVFVRPSATQVERSESNSRQIGSQYQSGTRRVQNPAYAEALEALRDAQDELERVQRTTANSSANSAQGTLGALAAIVSVATESAAESRVSSAQRTLDGTPQVLEQAVLVPYAYSARTVVVKQ